MGGECTMAELKKIIRSLECDYTKKHCAAIFAMKTIQF